MDGEKTKRARELRKQGLSYRQIADELQCSQNYVGWLLCDFNPHHFQAITQEACIYPGLRKWMNENTVGRNELLRRMEKNGWFVSPATVTNLMRGNHNPTKYAIDGILRVTGMTYEECFGGAEDGHLCGLAWTEEKKPELMDIPSRILKNE